MVRNTGSFASTTPESTLVFIVGHCEEFDAGRADNGDKQLDLCFHLYGARRVVFVKDDECTDLNCQEQLERLLQTSRQGDTLVFYYGGHGSKEAFKTIGQHWTYQNVVDTIEKRFRGDKVWCLIDCCYSGCFSRSIWPTSTKSWLCAMSTEATVTAGEDWCMTETFAKAMKGMYSKPGAASDAAVNNDYPLLTQDVVELMEDHHAIRKDDWMQATLNGRSIDPMAPFPFLISKERLIMKPRTDSFGFINLIIRFICSVFYGTHHPLVSSSSNQEERLALNVQETVIEPVVDRMLWKRQVALRKGDKVYCKWRGGAPNPGSSYLFPLYFPATLLSDPAQKDVEVEFDYKEQYWKATVPFRTHVVPATYLWACVDDVLDAHRFLTKHGRYLDATVPPGTKVWALFKDDDVVYTGTVLDYHETDWHEVEVHDYYEHVTGPFLWVEWKDEDGNNDIIPKHHCVVQSSTSTEPTLKELQLKASQELPAISAREAILRHMETLGKKLVLEQPQDVMCLWDGEWHPARTCDQMPLCETLREHLEFQNCEGNYYCVYWTNEDAYNVVPEELIRRSGDI